MLWYYFLLAGANRVTSCQLVLMVVFSYKLLSAQFYPRLECWEKGFIRTVFDCPKMAANGCTAFQVFLPLLFGLAPPRELPQVEEPIAEQESLWRHKGEKLPFPPKASWSPRCRWIQLSPYWCGCVWWWWASGGGDRIGLLAPFPSLLIAFLERCCLMASQDIKGATAVLDVI